MSATRSSVRAERTALDEQSGRHALRSSREERPVSPKMEKLASDATPMPPKT
jgi:hypothetical protein